MTLIKRQPVGLGIEDLKFEVEALGSGLAAYSEKISKRPSMKIPHHILLLSLFVLTACTFTIPQFNGLRANSGGILASAKLAEFDAPPPAMKDLETVRGREYDFTLTTISENRENCLVAHNHREAPVSVRIDLSRQDNVSSDREFPFEYVVPPHTDACIVRLFAFDRKNGYSYQLNQSWSVGDYTARHKPQRGYRLPWAPGESYVVSQAPGGPITTHTDPSSRNAVDFTMPAGTPVHAARSGVVINLEDAFKVGGLDRALVDKANFVDILHDDGTVASYAHLSEHSLAVRLGQPVSAGEKLGLSGSTGYSTGPHLHFAVWKLESTFKGFERVSVPVEFCIDDNLPCAALSYGSTVTEKRTVSGSSLKKDR